MRTILAIIFMTFATQASAEEIRLECDVGLWKFDKNLDNEQYISHQTETFMFDMTAPGSQTFETSFAMWNLQHQDRCNSYSDTSSDAIQRTSEEFRAYCWGNDGVPPETHFFRVNRYSGDFTGRIDCETCGDSSIFWIEGSCEKAKQKF